MTAIDPEALGARAETLLVDLAKISAEPDRLVRLFLTPEHRRAANQVAAWLRDAGLAVTEDALGTVRGRWAAADEVKGASVAPRRLLIGSHIDTVIDAGRYDGPFGVIAGLLAIEHFMRAGRRFPFGIDVLAFGDEEGSRFSATLTSSAAVAGAFDEGRLEVTDFDGVTLADAVAAYGKSAADIPAAAYSPGEAAAYVEVHIEQGPVLEAMDQPLGVVTGIYGQTRLSIDVLGEAGHAGTVPMRLRRDALAGAAEMTLVAERLARESKGAVVATVGHLVAQPNASNVIAAHVAFTLDVRSGSDAARDDLVQKFRAGAREAADRRHLGLTITTHRSVPTTPCDARVQDGLAAAVAEVAPSRRDPLRLGSGAGHDGQMMARLCSIGMLFVRCRGGISHNPMEYASPPDMGLAIAALIRFIERFEA